MGSWCIGNNIAGDINFQLVDQRGTFDHERSLETNVTVSDDSIRLQGKEFHVHKVLDISQNVFCNFSKLCSKVAQKIKKG